MKLKFRRRKAKRRRHILNGYPQPVIPNELSLMSKYQLICYLTALAVTLFLFICWHSKNKREIICQFEEISSADAFRSDTLNNVNRTFIYNLTIPMTYEASDSSWRSMKYVYVRDMINKDSTWYFNGNIEIIGKSDTMWRYNGTAGKISKQNHGHLNKPYLNMESLINRFHNIDENAYLSDINKYNERFFYTKEKFYFGRLSNLITKIKSEKKEFIRDTAYIKDCYFNYERLMRDFWIRDREHKIKLTGMFMPFSTSITRPKWYSLYDISQSYFTIKLLTNSIDSVSLTVDLVGASEFFTINDKPTDVYGNKIIFNKRMKPGDEITIKFYARCKDLENLQTVRVFFITAFLSGLIMTFLAFFIIYFYRVYKFRKESITDETQRFELENEIDDSNKLN